MERFSTRIVVGSMFFFRDLFIKCLFVLYTYIYIGRCRLKCSSHCYLCYPPLFINAEIYTALKAKTTTMAKIIGAVFSSNPSERRMLSKRARA
jgi:hypothetical protein